ncbi:hypothetical protein QVD17_35115 [Tagetes erecta]|uniref:Uncharacterized protein n=1 Tax=Tagetes erecta TaxID=13708 RepID=A0AAD8NMA2_TARER|nr:hypothetical protein QVD17_35115 [Tagetes erecta]
MLTNQINLHTHTTQTIDPLKYVNKTHTNETLTPFSLTTHTLVLSRPPYPSSLLPLKPFFTPLISLNSIAHIQIQWY